MLRGRNILITGASRGLGRAVAEACVRQGANVMLWARDSEALAEVRQELETIAPEQNVQVFSADVGSEFHRRILLPYVLAASGTLHGVVNNAGVAGPIGLLEETDTEDWESAIRTNLFGPVGICRALVPHFRSAGYGKIVNISGGGATAPMPHFTAYAASKAALVRFTETLAEETKGFGIDVNAVSPGALKTQMAQQVIDAGPERAGAKHYERMRKMWDEGGSSLEQAADLCAFLLSAESDGITGKLISAVWDPWRELPAKRSAIAESDVYTLRRITPKDRGLAE